MLKKIIQDRQESSQSSNVKNVTLQQLYWVNAIYVPLGNGMHNVREEPNLSQMPFPYVSWS